MGWSLLQRSDSRTRAVCVRDDEEGHLICRTGDVLQERCTHCHYSTPIVTFLPISSTIEQNFTWGRMMVVVVVVITMSW